MNRLKRNILLIIMCILFGVSAKGQIVADSVKFALESSDDDSTRISMLIEMGANQSQRFPLNSIEILEIALDVIEDMDDLDDTLRSQLQISALSTLSEGYRNVGDEEQSMRYLLGVFQLATSIGDKSEEEKAIINLGVAYENQGMYDDAIDYYRRAYALAKEEESRYGQAMALGNIGSCLEEGNSDSSLFYFKSALEMMNHPEMYDREASMGWMMNNIGSWYADQGQLDSALYFYHNSEAIREAIDNRVGLCVTYRDLAKVYWRLGQKQKALNYIDKSIQIGEENELISMIYESYKFRSEIKLSLKKNLSAYQDYKLYVMMRDSVRSQREAKSILRQTISYDYDKKHLADSLMYQAKIAMKAEEVRREKVVRNGFMGGFVLVALFAVVFFFQRNRISKEKERSEELLLNILPEEVAEELKLNGEAEAKLIDQVTVLFTDFKGFTALSEKLSPKELVKDLNECFSAFDRICEKYGIEKIKTIGDAYMAAGGLPTPNKTHTADVVNAAFEMRDFIQAGKQKKIEAGLPYFEIRIGIHTGPVVAGIVGVKKFQYDIWGDTVNTASRMESSGEAGKINISGLTHASLKEEKNKDFQFTSRGKIQAKGKGELEMFFVEKA